MLHTCPTPAGPAPAGGFSLLPMSHTLKPIHLLAALLIMLIWGCNFVAIRYGLDEQPPLFLTFLRFLFSAVPAVFFLHPPPLPWHQVASYGIIIFALQFSFVFSGMQAGVSPGLASVVLQLAVFITIGLATLFLGERPHPSQWLGALIGFAGVCLIALHQGTDATLPGLALLLAGALCWSSGNIMAKGFRQPVDALALVAWGSLAAAPFQLLLALGLEGPARLLSSLQHASWISVAAVAYLAWLSTLVGYGLWSHLLRHYPAGTVAPLSLLVPIIGLTASALVLGERLQGWKLMATLLVLLGLSINLFGARLLSRLRQPPCRQDPN